MPRIQVIADDGWVALDEHACNAQVASNHYRQQLAERLAWAVRDAESHCDTATPFIVQAERPLRTAA